MPVRSFNHGEHQSHVSGPWFPVTQRRRRSLATVPGALSSLRRSSHRLIWAWQTLVPALAVSLGRGNQRIVLPGGFSLIAKRARDLHCRWGRETGLTRRDLGSAVWLPACSAPKGTVALGYRFPVTISSHWEQLQGSGGHIFWSPSRTTFTCQPSLPLYVLVTCHSP